MEKLKSVSFEHGGQQYEIIVSRSDNRYRIQALLDNKPVNPWIYWVEYVNNVDFGLKFGVSVCDLSSVNYNFPSMTVFSTLSS